MTLVESALLVRSHEANHRADYTGLRESLKLCFDVEFSILDTQAGEFLEVGDVQYRGDARTQADVCREVLRRGHPEFIAEADSVAVLCVPLCETELSQCVAIAPFAVRGADKLTLARSAAALGFDHQQSVEWAARQAVLPHSRLLHLAGLVAAHRGIELRIRQTQSQLDDISGDLANAHEELHLLYGLTQKLKISASIEELGQKALEWLAEAIPAEGFVLELLPPPKRGNDIGPPARQPTFLQFGHCPVDRDQFSRLIAGLDFGPRAHPVFVNADGQAFQQWPLEKVRQLVIVPLTQGDNLFGWLAAIIHDEQRQLGSSEASLLASVAAILGTHAGNIELYRLQAEFLAGVVRAMSSSIDAKDPYTCGHSDRVASIAVLLAKKLGCSDKDLQTIYLSGLLHDIGKIGIDDHVLRKAGKLTQAEYEHIKMHAEIGYRILKDLKQLDQVLPVVRHHHESWDGSGYPFGLAGEEIPFFARIVAVADACDAMSSDRPYRKGMDDERIDAILHEGAGSQWDPRVVEAFFAAREEIRGIGRAQNEPPVAELMAIS
jgi:putative nucleotidyltransferase with HDIG domain